MATYTLSGSGVQALSSNVTALHITISTLPASAGPGSANPVNYYDVGVLRFGDATGYFDAVPVVGGPQWASVPVGVTRVGYALQPGAMVSVAEVLGGTPPFGGPPGPAGPAGPPGPSGGGGGWDAPLIPPPTVAGGNWTWNNQGGATADESHGGIYLFAPTSPGDQLRMLLRTAPVPPYTVTAKLAPHITSINYGSVGLMWWNTSTGSGVSFAVNMNSATSTFNVVQWRNAQNNSNTYASPTVVWGGPLWMQIRDDGTNRICRWSINGWNWVQVHSISRTDFVTATQYGIFADSNNGQWPAAMHLLSWQESTP
jgi:hypothetical protein